MSDGASKAVADSTGYAVYSAPMSEAKQNHAAMLQLTETWPRALDAAVKERLLARLDDPDWRVRLAVAQALSGQALDAAVKERLLSSLGTQP